MRPEDFGVAPVWVDTGDVAWTPGAGFHGVGVYIEGAGNLIFTSKNGTEITMAVPANFQLPGRVQAISASSTCTGIFVAVVKS